MTNELTEYEASQQRLRSEYEGNQIEDINITVPKEPEVNPEIYRDVEPLLFRGFLTVAADIADVHFVFKSLNHHELDLLRFTGHFRDGRVTDRFWSTFIAYGVFMVDGVNILPDRERAFPDLKRLFDAFPKEAVATIVRHISEINRKANRAVPLTEAYAMETVSRYRWLQIKGMDLTSVSVTGVDGTQRLGLNWSQQLWRALNQVEDRNESYEREWENSKFIGSCFAGKGISKIYDQDNDRRRKDREERSSRKDRILREVVLGEKPEANVLTIPGAQITGARTVEELATQLEKDLRGEKDWHDQVIEAHEARIRDRLKERNAQLETAAKETSARYGDQMIFGETTSAEGLTPQQVQEMVSNRKQLQAQAAARMMTGPDEKTEKFLDRWAVADSGVTSEVSTTERDPEGAVPVNTNPRTPSIPFRRK